VKQAGSLVASDRLRFDFTHFSQVDAGTLDRIETLVNNRIRDNVAVEIDEMDIESAFHSGATALFEEKYGDRVRVISLAAFSRELCGGTHTRRTGDIGFFKIVSESSVASGVRRIEAVTGQAALVHVQDQAKIIRDTSRLVKEKPDALVQRLEKMLTHQKTLEKEVEKLQAVIASQTADNAAAETQQVNGVTLLSKRVTVDTPAALRDMADKFKDKMKSGIVLLGSVIGSKVLLIVLVTQDLTDRYHAGKIVKEVAGIVGGGGGGRPDMAQAGGTQPEKLDQALTKFFEIVAKG
jgi:alanyl-tRNA synthetase